MCSGVWHARADRWAIQLLEAALNRPYFSCASSCVFPYTGPHNVGTIDVELPISELESPSPALTDDILTIQYRTSYPCVPDAKCKKSVNWLQAPQRGYVSAYTQFLGAGSLLADV